MSTAPPSIEIFAPAKINLYLHVTGKRADGYHALDSLVTFADIGDKITLQPMDGLFFETTGPFAHAFSEHDKSVLPDSPNLIIQAIWSLARFANRKPAFSITLEKNLPLGAGIGGGSADAAAVLWGLSRLWDIAPDMNILGDLMMDLGADVPVCFSSRTRYVAGAGETLSQPIEMPEIHAVLVNPLKPCSTKTIFKAYGGDIVAPADRIQKFEDADSLLGYLDDKLNMLTHAAKSEVPEIENCLRQIETTDACELSRMSGSGSTCFGLFKTLKDAQNAERSIREHNPDWWVKATTLGQIERY